MFVSPEEASWAVGLSFALPKVVLCDDVFLPTPEFVFFLSWPHGSGRALNFLADLAEANFPGWHIVGHSKKRGFCSFGLWRNARQRKDTGWGIVLLVVFFFGGFRSVFFCPPAPWMGGWGCRSVLVSLCLRNGRTALVVLPPAAPISPVARGRGAP